MASTQDSTPNPAAEVTGDIGVLVTETVGVWLQIRLAFLPIIVAKGTQAHIAQCESWPHPGSGEWSHCPQKKKRAERWEGAGHSRKTIRCCDSKIRGNGCPRDPDQPRSLQWCGEMWPQINEGVYTCLVPMTALGTCGLGLRVWRSAEDGASSWLRDGKGDLSLNITNGSTVLQ